MSDEAQLGVGRILVVDDDTHIRELCRIYLENAGWSVVEAENGLEVQGILAHTSVDLVVLDLMLPGIDGFEVINRIRQERVWVPIILLTAIGDEEDRILGLERGADDYLTKPFSPKELVARIRAVLRRMLSQNDLSVDENVMRFPGGLEIDNGRKEIRVMGEILTLTPREFDLLGFLAQNAQQVFSRQQLLDRVWGFDFDGDDRTVDVHVTRLRQKLSAANNQFQFLETVWGHGYRFQPKVREKS